MIRGLFQILIIILTIFQLNSCRNQIKPRTVYWSGSLLTLKNDSSSEWSFYLGYYIELSDTGETKIMTRKMFQSPKEYYKIILPDSIKNTILTIVSNDSIYFVPKKNSYGGYIYDGLYDGLYDGFTYNLSFKYDTIDNKIAFITPVANQTQKKLIRIMDRIWNNPLIIKETNIDLNQYENIIEKERLENFHPARRVKGKFKPPVIVPDMDM